MLKPIIGFVHGSLIYEHRIQVLACRIDKLVPKSATVLDVGSGDGRIASVLQKRRPDLHVEGLDIFIRNLTHISVRLFDGQKIPYSDQSVDVITFIDVLHHTVDPQRLLLEAARVARKFIIIKDHFSENSLDYMTLKLMEWIGNARHRVSLPYNYQSRRIWIENFAAAKLEMQVLDENVSLYHPPFSIIFGRGLHFIAQMRPGKTMSAAAIPV